MKSTYIFVLALAVTLSCVPAVAQHARPGGMAGGMGGGAASSMGHTGSSHNPNVGTGSTAAGKAMDQILSNNAQLSSKIQKLTGMTAQDACGGFKNLGQCVAAAHVSKNLGVNFACLKADMTGTAAPSGTSCGTTATNISSKSMSLGKAIQALSPAANSKAEAQKATKQANQDLSGSNS